MYLLRSLSHNDNIIFLVALLSFCHPCWLLLRHLPFSTLWIRCMVLQVKHPFYTIALRDGWPCYQLCLYKWTRFVKSSTSSFVICTFRFFTSKVINIRRRDHKIIDVDICLPSSHDWIHHYAMTPSTVWFTCGLFYTKCLERRLGSLNPLGDCRHCLRSSSYLPHFRLWCLVFFLYTWWFTSENTTTSNITLEYLFLHARLVNWLRTLVSW